MVNKKKSIDFKKAEKQIKMLDKMILDFSKYVIWHEKLINRTRKILDKLDKESKLGGRGK